MKYAISIKNLYKSYELIKGEQVTHQRNLREEVFSIFKKRKREKLDVLKDISFDLEKGEVIGLIGRNGAGKSTLLKLIAGITYPNHGSLSVSGRVGSLLEVGMGFHPDLTGRENIFLSGAILGMRRSEIKKHFDEIVAFSEVEKFMEMPVKKYSTGMYLKLAFSVMAFLEAEVLLIDEVLAVGDFAFQKKCLDKIREIIKQGKTCIFVSHNLEAIGSLCPKSILLENGSIAKNEDSQAVINYYYGNTKSTIFDYSAINRPKNGNFQFKKAWIENEKGERVTTLHSTKNYRFYVSYKMNEKIDDLKVELCLTFPDGKKLSSLVSKASQFGFLEGTILFDIKSLPLNKGFFHFNLMAKSHTIEDFIANAGSFNVLPQGDETFSHSLIVLDYEDKMAEETKRF